MSSWHSPQSIFHISRNTVAELFTVPVIVEEKVDGSFFAFGYYPDTENPLRIRSKGATMYVEAPQKMFAPAVETVKSLYDEGLLHPGWMYRGEMLGKPKHTALAYDRVPIGNVILFDVLTDDEEYLPYWDLQKEGVRLGLEVVPLMFSGKLDTAEQLRKLLECVSVLGGQKIEGVVIKPTVPIYGPDKKLMMAKFVSEAYTEVHDLTWKTGNPTSGDILLRLGTKYGTQARWQKAVQHLREKGLITDSPKDIGPILHEVWPDIMREEHEAIAKDLMKWAMPHVQRLVTRGLPEWYKNLLLETAFDNTTDM